MPKVQFLRVGLCTKFIFSEFVRIYRTNQTSTRRIRNVKLIKLRHSKTIEEKPS